MGMDVYGTAPTDPVGKYLRRTVWSWHPLIDLTEHLCEQAEQHDLFLRCESWHTNEGDGLNAEDALTLGALILEPALASGAVARYLEARQQHLAMLPDDPCPHCNATGTRTDAVGVSAGMPTRSIPSDAVDRRRGEPGKPHPRAGQTGWCNTCEGTGYRPPFQLNYHISEKGVREWAAFLKHCGGFEIC